MIFMLEAVSAVASGKDISPRVFSVVDADQF
jgi:hypothetical protein